MYLRNASYCLILSPFAGEIIFNIGGIWGPEALNVGDWSTWVGIAIEKSGGSKISTASHGRTQLDRNTFSRPRAGPQNRSLAAQIMGAYLKGAKNTYTKRNWHSLFNGAMP